MPQNPFCEAVRVGDGYFREWVVCHLCGLEWDATEPIPPACQFELNFQEQPKE